MATKLPTKAQVIAYCESQREVLHEKFPTIEDNVFDRLENLAMQGAYLDAAVFAKIGQKRSLK